MLTHIAARAFAGAAAVDVGFVRVGAAVAAARRCRASGTARARAARAASSAARITLPRLTRGSGFGAARPATAGSTDGARAASLGLPAARAGQAAARAGTRATALSSGIRIVFGGERVEIGGARPERRSEHGQSREEAKAYRHAERQSERSIRDRSDRSRHASATRPRRPPRVAGRVSIAILNFANGATRATPANDDCSAPRSRAPTSPNTTARSPTSALSPDAAHSRLHLARARRAIAEGRIG